MYLQPLKGQKNGITSWWLSQLGFRNLRASVLYLFPPSPHHSTTLPPAQQHNLGLLRWWRLRYCLTVHGPVQRLHRIGRRLGGWRLLRSLHGRQALPAGFHQYLVAAEERIGGYGGWARGVLDRELEGVGPRVVLDVVGPVLVVDGPVAVGGVDDAEPIEKD